MSVNPSGLRETLYFWQLKSVLYWHYCLLVLFLGDRIWVWISQYSRSPSVPLEMHVFKQCTVLNVCVCVCDIFVCVISLCVWYPFVCVCVFVCVCALLHYWMRVVFCVCLGTRRILRAHIYSVSQSLWYISQIRIKILKTTCSILGYLRLRQYQSSRFPVPDIHVVLTSSQWRSYVDQNVL